MDSIQIKGLPSFLSSTLRIAVFIVLLAQDIVHAGQTSSSPTESPSGYKFFNGLVTLKIKYVSQIMSSTIEKEFAYLTRSYLTESFDSETYGIKTFNVMINEQKVIEETSWTHNGGRALSDYNTIYTLWVQLNIIAEHESDVGNEVYVSVLQNFFLKHQEEFASYLMEEESETSYFQDVIGTTLISSFTTQRIRMQSRVKLIVPFVVSVLMGFVIIGFLIGASVSLIRRKTVTSIDRRPFVDMKNDFSSNIDDFSLEDGINSVSSYRLESSNRDKVKCENVNGEEENKLKQGSLSSQADKEPHYNNQERNVEKEQKQENQDNSDDYSRFLENNKSKTTVSANSVLCLESKYSCQSEAKEIIMESKEVINQDIKNVIRDCSNLLQNPRGHEPEILSTKQEKRSQKSVHNEQPCPHRHQNSLADKTSYVMGRKESKVCELPILSVPQIITHKGQDDEYSCITEDTKGLDEVSKQINKTQTDLLTSPEKNRDLFKSVKNNAQVCAVNFGAPSDQKVLTEDTCVAVQKSKIDVPKLVTKKNSNASCSGITEDTPLHPKRIVIGRPIASTSLVKEESFDTRDRKQHFESGLSNNLKDTSIPGKTLPNKAGPLPNSKPNSKAQRKADHSTKYCSDNRLKKELKEEEIHELNHDSKQEVYRTRTLMNKSKNQEEMLSNKRVVHELAKPNMLYVTISHELNDVHSGITEDISAIFPVQGKLGNLKGEGNNVDRFKNGSGLIITEKNEGDKKLTAGDGSALNLRSSTLKSNIVAINKNEIGDERAVGIPSVILSTGKQHNDDFSCITQDTGLKEGITKSCHSFIKESRTNISSKYTRHKFETHNWTSEPKNSAQHLAVDMQRKESRRERTNITGAREARKPKILNSQGIRRDCYAPPGKLGVTVTTSHVMKFGDDFYSIPLVKEIKKGSPLEGTFFPGDRIIAINDIETLDMSANQVMNLMVKFGGGIRKISFLSG